MWKVKDQNILQPKLNYIILLVFQEKGMTHGSNPQPFTLEQIKEYHIYVYTVAWRVLCNVESPIGLEFWTFLQQNE